jgi:hypothetical protein
MSEAGSLLLDDHSLILAQKGVLHVFSQRGAFDLRARDIDTLHARLTPFLQGTHAEWTLLEAVPSAALESLRSYLEKLRQAGALRTLSAEPETSDTPPPVANLGPARPCGRFTWKGRIVNVSLNGPGSASLPAGVASLEFLSPLDAGRWLARLGEPGLSPPACRTCVIDATAPDLPSERDLLIRAACARWLLGSGIDCEQAGRTLVFELDAPRGILRRLAVLDPSQPDHALRTLPDQLALIHSGDVDQLPLVVATAAHRFFAPMVQRMGLDYATVRDHLLRDFLVRLDVDTAGRETAVFFQGEIDAPLARYSRLELPREAALTMPVASTLLDLKIVLLERQAERLARQQDLPWREVDLLAGEEAHPTLQCLREILRLRRKNLRVRWTETGQGAILIADGRRCAASFVRAKAVAELLLYAIWDLFYGAPVAPLPTLAAHSFATRAELRRIAAVACRQSDPAALVLRVVRRWGITAWVGDWQVGGLKRE